MNVVKNISVYAISSIINGLIPFLLLPIISTLLSRSDIGIIATHNALIMILLPILVFGTTSSITVEFFRLEPNDFKVYFGNQLMLIGITTLSFTIIGCILSVFVGSYKGLNFFWLSVIPLMASIVGITDNFLSITRSKNKSYLYSLFVFFKIVLELTLTLFFLYYFLTNWQGRLVSQFITLIVTILISFYYFKKWDLLSFKYNKKYILDIIIFAPATILERFNIVILAQANRIFITDISEVGLFNMASTYASLVLVVIGSLSSTITPYIYSLLKQSSNDSLSKIRKTIFVVLILMFFVSIFLLLIKYLFFNFYIDKKFSNAQDFVLLSVLANFLSSITYLFKLFLLYQKSIKYLTITSIISIMLTIFLHYTFQNMGAKGINISTFVAYLLNFLLVIYFSFKTQIVKNIFWGN